MQDDDHGTYKGSRTRSVDRYLEEVRAIQPSTSWKRNDLEDFVIVQLERSRLLRTDYRKRDSDTSTARVLPEDPVDSTKDQFLGTVL